LWDAGHFQAFKACCCDEACGSPARTTQPVYTRVPMRQLSSRQTTACHNPVMQSAEHSLQSPHVDPLLLCQHRLPATCIMDPPTQSRLESVGRDQGQTVQYSLHDSPKGWIVRAQMFFVQCMCLSGQQEPYKGYCPCKVTSTLLPIHTPQWLSAAFA
jgi:hypothetical protein